MSESIAKLAAEAVARYALHTTLERHEWIYIPSLNIRVRKNKDGKLECVPIDEPNKSEGQH